MTRYKMHYEGPLKWTSGGWHHVAGGRFPVCCHGDKAHAVVRRGNQTRDRAKVDCAECIRILTVAGALP